MNHLITARKIEHNGIVVAERGEMMSLTDMWKAAGSPSGRAPADWLALVSTKEFVACVEASDIAGNSGIKAKTGRNGGTYAHWQIGLAYAKYLDHVFHMKCNTVVRERMEGKTVSVSSLPPEVLEMIRRDDGISRMLAHKVTQMEKAIGAILSVVTPAQPVIVRHGRTAGQILKDAGFERPKGLPAWFGNLLTKFGCRVEHNAYSEMGLTKARLFDPDRAALFLQNGGRVAVQQKIAERKGQRNLRLISPVMEG